MSRALGTAMLIALASACYDFQTASETCRRLGRCPSTDDDGDTSISDGGPSEVDGGGDGGALDDAGSTDGGIDGGAFVETSCSDGVDNDGDSLTDCADSDCTGITCAAGSCANGVCVGAASLNGRACASATDCNGVCGNGLCTVPSGVGGPCSSSAECQTGMTCRLTLATGGATYPGGYCTLIGCSDSTRCPSGSLCLGMGAEIGEPTPFCARTCTSNSECRMGYGCVQFFGAPYPGVCFISPLPSPDAGPPSNKVGSSCIDATQCTNPPTDGFCLSATLPDGGATGFTGGYCSAYCISDAHCASDGGAFCAGIQPDSTQQSAWCIQACTGPGMGQGSCRAGYVCRGYDTFLSDGGFGPSPTGYCWNN